jgi:hypothetical protein
MMALLLATALADPTVPLDPANVWTAPPPLSLDAHGLPGPVETADGTLLPPRLADWVRARLSDYATYPGRCQARLDAAHRVAEAKLHEALSLDAAGDALAEAELEQEAASRWPSWAVAASFALGVAAGGATLYLAAQVVR